MPPTGSAYPPRRIKLSLSPTVSPETQRRLLEADRRWRVKAILRIGAAIFALIGFSLFAAAIPQWDDNFFYESGPSSGDWTDGMPIAALVFAFLYNIIYLGVVLFRKTVIPSLVPVIVDFLVWGALVPSITFAAWGGLFLFWTPAVVDQDGQVICDELNIFAKECNPIFYTVGSLELAGVIFAIFVCVIHIALFVMACMDLHKQRKSRKAALAAHSPEQQRRLDHQDFVELNERHTSTPPPRYDADHASNKEVDMATSPVAREFV